LTHLQCSLIATSSTPVKSVVPPGFSLVKALSTSAGFLIFEYFLTAPKNPKINKN
jgi:hypothetical protein